MEELWSSGKAIRMERLQLANLSTEPMQQPHHHSERKAITFIFTQATFAGKFNHKIAWNLLLIEFDLNFRSVQLFYDGTTSYNGINAYRYSHGQNFLNEFSDCFCINKIKDALTDDKGCLYPGALDLSECLGKKNSQKTSMSGCWQVYFLFRCTRCCYNATLFRRWPAL